MTQGAGLRHDPPMTAKVRFLETMIAVACQAERIGIVHRDIKPENVLVRGQNEVKVLDFGIARHLDLESMTPTDARFGLFTLGYSASEQMRNLKRAIDSRADLFAIAVVATEMHSGINPYVRDAKAPMEVLRRIESNPVPWTTFEDDPQHQLATFVRVLGDHHRNRRPRTAQLAWDLLQTVKSTLPGG